MLKDKNNEASDTLQEERQEAEIFKGMDKYINSDGTVKTANALFE